MRDLVLSQNKALIRVYTWNHVAELVINVGDFIELHDCKITHNKVRNLKELSVNLADNILVSSYNNLI